MGATLGQRDLLGADSFGIGLKCTHSLPDKIGGWIMQESLENSHQGVLVLSQQAECNFTSPSEGTYTMDVSVRVKPGNILKRTIVSVSAKGIDHVMSQSEWYHLGFLKSLAFVKETVEINM